MQINDLTHKVIGCSYKVHNVLGPGFLEKVYENSLKLELQRLGIRAQQQVKLPVWYEGYRLESIIPISVSKGS
jgi:GxxExxY protein